MQITVHFWSYFRDLTGLASEILELEEGVSVETAVTEVMKRYPKLIPLRNSTLVAVGVDYADSATRLRAGDELSLFPPVQGG